MANIQTEIEKISTAVYGDEVRGAIVNSLTELNSKKPDEADVITNTNGSVKSNNIANGAVKWYHIEDTAVNVNKLGDKAVTMPKLSDDVVAIITNKADKPEVETALSKKQDTENIVNDKRYVTDAKKNYPSISYLDSYYYDIEDTDGLLSEKADKTEVDTALADKADKSDVYSKSESNTKLATKINNADGSVHYTNLAADVFGEIKGGSLGAARGTDVFVALSKKMDKSEIEQGTAPMTIDGYTKDDFYALNCRYQMVGDYCHITFTANPKVAINSPLVFSGLPFVAYNTSILGAYTNKNNPVKIEITNDTSNLTITKINGEPFAVGESSTFTIGHRIKE